MKKTHLIPAFFALTALSGAAFAEGDKAPEFSQADTDGDGVLSTDEAREALPEEVVIVDTNNDGMLNRDEAQAAMPELSFSGEASGQDQGIGEQEYSEIVESLEGGQSGQSQESELTEEDYELDEQG